MTTITPRAEKAINILVDAYNNDHLAAGHCGACAVGNLIACGLGAKIEKTEEFLPGFMAMKNGIRVNNHSWVPVFRNPLFEMMIDIKGMTSGTGYSVDELKEVEKAFEDNTEHKYETSLLVPKECFRKDQLKGLKAVVKTLLKLDNCENVDFSEVFLNKIKTTNTITSET